jgi:hypothetical protein
MSRKKNFIRNGTDEAVTRKIGPNKVVGGLSAHLLSVITRIGPQFERPPLERFDAMTAVLRFNLLNKLSQPMTSI